MGSIAGFTDVLRVYSIPEQRNKVAGPCRRYSGERSSRRAFRLTRSAEFVLKYCDIMVREPRGHVPVSGPSGRASGT